VLDLLYTMLHYNGATEAAMPDARRALETLFADENAPGPVKAAQFVLGHVRADEASDTRLRRQQVSQDIVFAVAAHRRAL